jgi:hypothetical protein
MRRVTEGKRMEQEYTTPAWWRRAGRPGVVVASLAVAVGVTVAVRRHPLAQISVVVVAVTTVLAWAVIGCVQHVFAVRAEENDAAALRERMDEDRLLGTDRKPLARLSVRTAAADLLIGTERRDPARPMGQLPTRLEALAVTRHGREAVLRLVLASALCALQDVSDYEGHFPSFRVQLLAGWPYDEPVELGLTSMPVGAEARRTTRFALALGDAEPLWEIKMQHGPQGTRVSVRVLPDASPARPES